MSQTTTFLAEMVRAGTSAKNTNPYIQDASGTDAVRMAVGTSALVSGTGTIATGLNTVTAFIATITGPASYTTGANEVNEIVVASITTGSVSVQGLFSSFVTGATTKSVSGTAAFAWLAYGT